MFASEMIGYDPPMQDKLGTWPIRCPEIPVAWGNMDAFGHVNNTVYLQWFETARIAYFDAIKLPDKLVMGRPVGVGPILARATIDFKLPLTYPDIVTPEATVTRIGNSSFVMEYRVSSQVHNGAVAAVGEGVIVVFDYDTGKKSTVTEQLRQRIIQTEGGSASGKT